MSSTFFTPKQIIELYAKHGAGNLFKINTKKVGKNKDATVYYVPFSCIDQTGKFVPLRLQVKKQILASKAKLPPKTTPETTKKLQVSFMHLDEEMLSVSDYPDDKKDVLMTNNDELLECFNIIAEEYNLMITNQVMDYSGNDFEIGNNKTINSFRQTSRKASEAEIEADKGRAKENKIVKNKSIMLPTPIFRCSLPVDGANKRKIGKSYPGKPMRYIVYDATKLDSKNPKAKPVPAKIKQNGNIVDLDVNNCGNFVTRFSLFSGLIDFPQFSISQQGFSIISEFYDMHLWRHRPMEMETVNHDDMDDLRNMGLQVADDDYPDVDEPVETPTKGPVKGKGKFVKETNSVPDDEEEPDEQTMESVQSALAKKTTKPVAKPAPASTPAKPAVSKNVKKPAPAPEPEPEPEPEEADDVNEDAEESALADDNDAEPVEEEAEPAPEPVKKAPLKKDNLKAGARAKKSG